ncbi:hypothetical protein KHA93_09115 [Bacillus sp. FJAT-49732]|uniref:Pilus assembly protein PilO n=1 Tax=Lederbergia citrisecunda TaxID=2833583 RepID=A0A942TN65_9BACI|nr:GspMb/PilO family protein [Lederbergia citrisecunda]MBS4199816.1 hypothetical protein [Lederbergia citrisecunda]
MPLQWLKNKWTLISIFTIALLCFIAFFYISQYKPIAKHTSLLESELKMEQNVLHKLNETQTEENPLHLVKKIPVNPFIDQFILDVEKLEKSSGVIINEMNFTDGTFVTIDSNDEQEAQNSTLPNGLEKITVNLLIKAKSYVEIEAFLRDLESQTRIVHIEQISVTGPDIIVSEKEKDNGYSVQITLSVFYMPELNELKAEVPKMDVPKPANKKNPFKR